MTTAATISIVSHGHGALLDLALNDLSQQSARDRLLVIVTLNLVDEPFDLARYPQLKITVVRNAQPKGFGANHNAAFLKSQGLWFFVVNPDVRILDVSAIDRLIQTPQDVSAGVTSPRIVNSSGTAEDAVRPNLSLSSLLARVLGGRRKPLISTVTRKGHPFFWVAGMFMAIRSEVFEQVGGFDERYFLYCEDYDLCARIYLAGHAILVREDVQVVHDAQRDSHRSSRHLRWHVQSLLKVWSSKAFWRVVLY